MTLTHQRKFTYEDYKKLPDFPKMELINGELIVSPSPTYRHQEISNRIASPLWQWVEDHRLGKVVSAPMDVVFSDRRTFQPDILFISKRRMGIIRQKIHGAPDLVIEILSPSNANLIDKWQVYEKYGVREYWVVEPDKRSVTVFLRQGKAFQVAGVYYHSKDVVKSSVVDGFRLPISRLFRGLKKH